jgi:hypothetical protein
VSRTPEELTWIGRNRVSRRAVAIVLVAITSGAWARQTSRAIAAPELPRVVPESADPYPGRPCSVTLGARDDITDALRDARGGTVVCLTAGATYAPFELPPRKRGDSGWIVLRTNTASPSEGTRVRPSTAANFAKIVQTKNGAPALWTSPGASRYVLRDFEITTGQGVNKTNALVALGTSGPDQDTMNEVPGELILARLYIHGSANGEMQRCVALNSGATAIVDSWISDCHGKGYDSQAIGGWNGPGPHLIRNNYLEGAGENVMWGGATPSIRNMVAADITFQRNHVYTPIAWKGRWTKKNLFELKNAVRVLVEENVFDGSWADAQIGPALLFKSINDQGDCNWCRTTDVTVRRSYVTHAGGGIVFSGAENYNGGRVDTAARRFLIQDVVFDKLNVPPYTGGGRAVQITGGASDIVFERTVISGNVGNAIVLDKGRPAARTAFRNNVWTHGEYLATADGPGIGLPSMNAGLPGFVWQRMTIVKRASANNPLPPGTAVATSEDAVPLARQIRATVAAAVRGVVTP